MDKLHMCRICLAENVDMYVVVNKTLHELYEKLTDNPLVTEDSRPILACFICCAQLKKCYRFMKKCLEAEEMFAKMMNEEYEIKPLINQDQFELFHGFIRTPIDTISIVDVDQTESIVVKEELPADCERLDDIESTKKECKSDDDKMVNVYDSCLDKDVKPLHDLESDFETDPLKVEIEVEEEQISECKRKEAPVVKNQAYTGTAEQNNTNLKIIQDTETSTPEHLVARKRKAENIINNTVVDIDYRSNSNEEIRLIKDDKPYKCDTCKQSFSQSGNLKRHIRIHTGEKPYKCDICTKTFINKRDLEIHNSIHTGEKPFKCHLCEQSFKIKSSLTKHVQVHTGEKPYKCDICFSSFTEKKSLTKHILIHTGEKPYKCDICEKDFARKSYLRLHNRTHTGEKPYKCEKCQSSFIRKVDLSKHIRIHMDVKPFKCDICLSTFSQKAQLIRHSRTHTGEKPYKCDFCLRRFSDTSALKRHIREQHNSISVAVG